MSRLVTGFLLEGIRVATFLLSMSSHGRSARLPASKLNGRAIREPRNADDAVERMVEGCQADDPDSQRQLYELFKDLVYRLVLRMVGRENALDLSQQVFLTVFRNIGRFCGRSQFKTWLYRLAVNECLQFRRRVRRDDCSLEHDPMDESTSGELRSDDREILDYALLKIEPDLRAIFLLREVEGLSYSEIADVLSVSDGTVASRLNRARSKLQEQLVALGWEP